jgi:hypothetical protein
MAADRHQVRLVDEHGWFSMRLLGGIGLRGMDFDAVSKLPRPMVGRCCYGDSRRATVAGFWCWHFHEYYKPGKLRRRAMLMVVERDNIAPVFVLS